VKGAKGLGRDKKLCVLGSLRTGDLLEGKQGGVREGDRKGVY